VINIYLLLLLVLLPLAGGLLRWLRLRLAEQPVSLRGEWRAAFAWLRASFSAAEVLGGLLGWFGAAFACASLLQGDLLTAALALEAAPLGIVLVALLAGDPWAQVGGARRLQLYAIASLGYFAALAALLQGGLRWEQAVGWDSRPLATLVRGLAAVLLLLALPGRLAAHPFAVGEDAERLAGRRAEATPAVLALLSWEAALPLFTATLMLPPLLGGVPVQVAAVVGLAGLLTVAVGFVSRRSSVQARPATAAAFYLRYNLSLAALLFVATLVSR